MKKTREVGAEMLDVPGFGDRLVYGQTGRERGFGIGLQLDGKLKKVIGRATALEATNSRGHQVADTCRVSQRDNSRSRYILAGGFGKLGKLRNRTRTLVENLE